MDVKKTINSLETIPYKKDLLKNKSKFQINKKKTKKLRSKNQ